jgi:hypothetical protein
MMDFTDEEKRNKQAMLDWLLSDDYYKQLVRQCIMYDFDSK